MQGPAEVKKNGITLLFQRSNPSKSFWKKGFGEKDLLQKVFSPSYLPAISLLRDHGQDDTAGGAGLVTDRLFCLSDFAAFGQMQSGIGIPVEGGEVAAADLDPDAVSGFEGPCGRPAVDVVRIHFSGLEQFLMIQSVAETCANDAIANIPLSSVT